MFDVSQDQQENFSFLTFVVGFILYSLTTNLLISFLVLILLQTCVCLYTYKYTVNRHNWFIKNLRLVSMEIIIPAIIINFLLMTNFVVMNNDTIVLIAIVLGVIVSIATYMMGKKMYTRKHKFDHQVVVVTCLLLEDKRIASYVLSVLFDPRMIDNNYS